VGEAPARGRPAIVALHGCGGLYARAQPHRLSARHAAHVQAWIDAGYAVLLPDSLAPRGVRELCTTRMRERTITAAQRRGDALGALAYLRARGGIDATRIALVGWSHGGSTTLATLDANDAAVASTKATGPFFRTAIAFYPGCTPSLRDARWSPAAPLAILIGADDDWTPAAACEQLGARGREAGWPLEVVVYPGAVHGFDAPSGEVRVRRDVPNGVRAGEGVHVGPEPKARAQANAKVAAILKDAFAP
jgi:dienelactone hydrolase